MTVSITIEDPKCPDAEVLLRESHTLMQALFAAEDNHFLSIEELCADNIQLFIARVDGVAAASGALKVMPDYGEVKSMFTTREFRGQGLAEAILSRIEDAAREKGLTILRLETGDLLLEAHRLYNRHGFVERGPFGDYEQSDASIFLEKQL